MPIYVDLQPDPQFDESLVHYCKINFDRLAFALLSARKRIQSEVISVNGPWSPQLININVPYRADVIVWGSIGFWHIGPSPGLIGMGMTWNGFTLPSKWDMYFNEVQSGKTLACANIARNINKGTYQLGQSKLTGYEGSDGNSRLRLEIIYYEL
jgi:hypothetical protein